MNILFLNNSHISTSNIRALLTVRGFILAVIFISSALITLLPGEYLTEQLAISAALVLATVGMLATGIVSEQLAVLIFFFFAMIGSVSAPEVVFSGFYSSAFWLVFGGLVIGAAVAVSYTHLRAHET